MSLTHERVGAGILVLGLLLVTLVGSNAVAQEVTGALQGTVVSAAGSPEPQVLLTVSSPNLQGTRGTSTDARGFYQFLALPPGLYDLRLSRVGLQPMEVKQVLVELGRTTAVPTLTVTAQPISMEPIVVQAPSITIDPSSTASGGTLRIKEYASLPVDRDYKSVIALLPQANASVRGDPINVGGSTGLENQYYIDGANVTDTRWANRATSLPYNFVRAVEAKTAGYEAQYGRALGAVVNALTYTGTNDFEASVFGFTQPGAWAMDPKETSGVSEGDLVSYDWGARASGPVMKDRLWYSAAVNPRADQVDKEIIGFGTYPDRTEAVRFATKLTWKASEATNLELSVFGDPTTRDQIDPLPGGMRGLGNPDPLLVTLKTGGTTAALRATVAASPSVLLLGSASRQWDRYSEVPTTEVGRTELRYNDYLNGWMEGGRGQEIVEDRGRTSLMARATMLFGNHTVVTGADYEDAEVTSRMEWLQISRVADSLYYKGWETYSGTFHNRSPAVYLQDSWRVTDRFTLNPGLRWSGQYLAGASGRTAQRISDEWQPRIGFSWALGKRSDQRFLGSYGRFYQTLTTNIPIYFYVDYTAITEVYSIDPRQSGAEPDTVMDYSSKEEDFAYQIPGLQAENFDEFTLGYERLVGQDTKVTLRALRRNLRSSFQWGLDYSQDPVWVFGTPGERNFDFLPRPKREYTSLEISVSGTLDRWQYLASYVLSRTWGNYPGLFNSDFGFTQPGGMSTFFMPHQATNSTGYLPNDRTHVGKLSGSYAAPFGLVAGGTLVYQTGSPINDFAADVNGPYVPRFLAPRGSVGRTPALWNLDLRLAYTIPAVRTTRAQVILDLLHVGNPRRVETVDEIHYMTMDENGDPASPNPQYRQATAYQPPMGVRLGMQVDF